MKNNFKKGVNHLKKGNYATAEKYFKKVLSANPKNTKALNNLALVYKNQSKFIEAIEIMKGILKLDKKNYVAHNNLANIYLYQRKFSEAKKHFLSAIGLKKDYADAIGNLGVLFQMMENYPQAARYYKKAIEIKPDSANHLSNLSSILEKSGKLNRAKVYAQRALELNSQDASTHNNYANVLRDLGNLIESEKHYKKAIKLDSRMAGAYANLVEVLLQTCSWKEVENYHQKLKDMGGETPFLAIRLNDNPNYNLSIAQSTSQHILDNAQRANLGLGYWLRKRKERIRVGYVGNVFNSHPTGRVMKPMFSLHNKKKFETFVFSYSQNDRSEVREEIKKKTEHFIDIRNLSDAAAAKKINKLKVEILVDLTGHTRGGRLGILAHHPSPFQFSWLGFPGSSGARFMEYLIADKVIVPESEIKHYSEKLIYMPGCYQINEGNPEVSEKEFDRAEYGIPPDSFVFVSLNRAVKIDEPTFKAWMKILNRVKKSTLVLLYDNEAATKVLKTEAKKAGINPERILFIPGLPHDEYLKRFSLFDLALDPIHYSGGATTADMLVMGLPVITTKGKGYLSRMTASHLTALGMKELIAKNISEYVNLAVSLAKNPKKLKLIRKKLIKNKKTSSLFDTKSFVAYLEKVFYNIVTGGVEDEIKKYESSPKKATSKKPG